jgi:hypothetical protein
MAKIILKKITASPFLKVPSRRLGGMKAIFASKSQTNARNEWTPMKNNVLKRFSISALISLALQVFGL